MTDSTYDTSPGVTWGVVSGGRVVSAPAEHEAEHVVIVNGTKLTGGGAPPAGTA